MDSLRSKAPPDDGYQTPQEVADQLRISLSQVYALVKRGPARGGLHGAKFGRLVRVTRASVEKYRAAAHEALSA